MGDPESILVITMPYLGDVLLATPLVHSLRQAYPNSRIDILVFENTAAMLEGNPDIDQIIITQNHPKLPDHWRLLSQIFRRYDFALALQTGDRPFFYSLLAAPFRVSIVRPRKNTGWWKRFFIQLWIESDNGDTHTVLQHLKLLDLIGVQRSFALIRPQLADVRPLLKQFPFFANNAPYIVLHPYPQWTYKRWTKEGWVAIGNYLAKSGYKILISGGPAPAEISYIADIVKKLPNDIINLAGQVSLAQLAEIITGARLFIGPDTGITHLAAATGIPVIALYGPTNPVKWAPWPRDYHRNVNPFNNVGNQLVNNIILCQGKADCVPCHLEGCDRHRQSRSRCLDTLSADSVIEAINRGLNLPAVANSLS
jgi:heptosyltransferase III